MTRQNVTSVYLLYLINPFLLEVLGFSECNTKGFWPRRKTTLTYDSYKYTGGRPTTWLKGRQVTRLEKEERKARAPQTKTCLTEVDVHARTSVSGNQKQGILPHKKGAHVVVAITVINSHSKTDI